MSSLPPLADAQDLAEVLGVPEENRKLQRALAAASADFRTAVRHPVSEVVGEVLVLDGNGARQLRLPVVNVTAVTAVVDTDSDAPVAVRWSADGLLERADGGLWPCRHRAVAVTVTHGLNPVPDDVAEAVLERAERRYRVTPGIRTKQVGGISVTFDPGISSAWVAAVELYARDGRA